MAFLAAIPAMIGTAATAIGTSTAGMTAATALGLGATALTIAGTLVDVNQQRGAAKANEMSAKIESKQIMEQANENARRRRVEAESFTSSQIAKLGATGVDFMGSPLDAIFESAARGELAARDIEYEGSVAAAGKKYEARLQRFRREQAVPMGVLKIGQQSLAGAQTLFGKTLGG